MLKFSINMSNKSQKLAKKSRSETRKNMKGKIGRNTSTLMTTLSNKSIRDIQKSIDSFEVKANKMLISPQNKRFEEMKITEKPSIAIFAGFRTTKGYHPK